MRLLVLTVLLAVLVLAPPAASAAVDCRPTRSGPQMDADIRRVPTKDRGEDRYIVSACDRRTGRRRTLRRAISRRGSTAGTLLVDLSVAGRRVAWIEAYLGRRGSAFTVAVADGRTGRRILRRRVLTTAGRMTWDLAGVALTRRGDLAWTVGPDYDEMRVVHLPWRGAPQEVARGRLHGLSVEDDTTLVWEDPLGYASHDLPGRDLGAGCPKRRPSYGRRRQFGDVVFTQRTRQAFAGEIVLLRACDARTGVDAIVGSAGTLHGYGGEYVDPAGGGNGWAAIEVEQGNRYVHCSGRALVTVDIATRRVGRGAVLPGDCEAAPLHAVVTTTGAPAWATGEGADVRLLTITENEQVELDRGAIGDVRAEGDEVVWTNAGEPRRARP